MNAITNAVTVRAAGAEDLDNWDQTARRFEGYRVVHRRAWLESLESSLRGTALYLLCERRGDVVGCWPGMLVKRGPIRSFGSPLPGSQTASMGPLFDKGRVTGKELVSSAVGFLEKRFGVIFVELISGLLDHQPMRDLGFRGREVMTHRLALKPGREEEVFKGFKESARRNVRRAIKLGLEVRFEDDERFVDEAYSQIEEGCTRRGHAMTFGIERARAFFRHMKAASNLVAVSVHLPDGGPSIATGMFTIEGKELLLWQWAHRTEYRWYRPTELMTWTVMQKAMAAGCEVLDLTGGGAFKRNFGATQDFSLRQWMRGRFKWYVHARHWAEQCYRWHLTWRDRLPGPHAGRSVES